MGDELPEVARSEPERWSAEVVPHGIYWFVSIKDAITGQTVEWWTRTEALARSLAAQVNAPPPSVDVTGPLLRWLNVRLASIESIDSYRQGYLDAIGDAITQTERFVAAVQAEAPETPSEPETKP